MKMNYRNWKQKVSWQEAQERLFCEEKMCQTILWHFFWIFNGLGQWSCTQFFAFLFKKGSFFRNKRNFLRFWNGNCSSDDDHKTDDNKKRRNFQFQKWKNPKSKKTFRHWLDFGPIVSECFVWLKWKCVVTISISWVVFVPSISMWVWRFSNQSF